MLDRSFVRGKNVAGLTVINTDVDPSTFSGAAAAAYVKNDNVIAVPSGEAATRPKRLALLITYIGSGPVPATTASVYAWAAEAQLWVVVQTGVALTYGTVAYVDIPTDAQGGTYAVVLTASSPPDGTYTTFAGFEYAGDSTTVVTGAGGAALAKAAQLPATLGPQTAATSLSVVSPSPTARAVVLAATPLPAAGAAAAVQSVAVPAGAKRAVFFVSYTRGAVGGQAAHRLWVGNGTETAQGLGADGSFNALTGRATTDGTAVLYSIHVDLLGGETAVGVDGAEIGVTATPGTWAVSVTFG